MLNLPALLWTNLRPCIPDPRDVLWWRFHDLELRRGFFHELYHRLDLCPFLLLGRPCLELPEQVLVRWLMGVGLSLIGGSGAFAMSFRACGASFAVVWSKLAAADVDCVAGFD